jgi:hypothetical protein
VPRLTRRSFLLGSGAAAVLAACGGDDGEATPTTAAPSTTAAAGGDSPVLGVAFDANGVLVAGIDQRAPFLLFESTGGLLASEDAPAELTFEITPDGGEALAPITVERHGDDVGRAYYPLVTTFAATGLHQVTASLDGALLEQTINVNPADAVAVPQVGQPLPGAPTPTVADPRGVQTICTADPVCPLHDVSLDAALAEGRPVALLVSTPAYCQVAICGPVLDVLVAAAPSVPDIAVIHLEVYPNGEPTAESISPVVTETLRLTYEPALLVADATGTVTARLDNVYDGAELAEALRGATA